MTRVNKDARRIYQRAMNCGWMVATEVGTHVVLEHELSAKQIRLPSRTSGFAPGERASAERIVAAVEQQVRKEERSQALEAEPADVNGELEPTITGVEPAMAKHHMTGHGGRVYEVTNVCRRSWSNGSVDYACTVDGCDFSSDTVKGTSIHRGLTHGALETPDINKSFVDPSRTWVPTTYQSSVITRLSNEIRDAMEDGHTDPLDLARAIAQSRAQNASFESDLAAPDRMLTPEQQLAAIRRILETGEEVLAREERERAQERKILALSQENTRLMAELEDGNKRLSEAREVFNLALDTFGEA